MDKVLVEVFVPVLDHSFDVFIPLQSPMFEVLELIKKQLSKCLVVVLSQMKTLQYAIEKMVQLLILIYRFMNLKSVMVQN